MWLGWVALCVCAANAGEPVRGVLLDLEGDNHAGQMSVRAADCHVRVLLYGAGTEIHRDDRVIPATALRPGDVVEAWCAGDAEPRCRAERIVVLKPAPPAPPAWPQTRWPQPQWGPLWPPRGQFVLAGLIAELNADHIRLRTRRGAEYLVRLRDDTMLVGNGLAASAGELRVNMHVFVRAGKGLEGDLEAFQVVWGRILPAR